MMEPHEAERRPKWLGICGKGSVACLLFFPKCGLKAPVWLRPGSAAWPTIAQCAWLGATGYTVVWCV